MVRPTLTSQEIAVIGERLYQDKLRTLVDPKHRGQYLVLDIDSGDYEVDEEDAAASARMLRRHPDGVLYGIRIGQPAAYDLGGPFAVQEV